MSRLHSLAISLKNINSEDIQVPQYRKEIDDVGGTVLYIGEASPGTATSAASWRIKRITFTGDDASTVWADGDENFDNIWDNRASLTYPS